MSQPLRRTRILATLGPATDAPGIIDALLAAGLNAVRLNFSHGTAGQHAERVAAVRAVASRTVREIGVLADLPGPKIRIEKFAEGKVLLKAGQSFALVCRADAPAGDITRVGCSYLGLPGDVVPGDTLLLDDGLISLRVNSVIGDVVNTEVLTDGALSNRKGLNRLGGGLNLGGVLRRDEFLQDRRGLRGLREGQQRDGGLAARGVGTAVTREHGRIGDDAGKPAARGGIGIGELRVGVVGQPLRDALR